MLRGWAEAVVAVLLPDLCPACDDVVEEGALFCPRCEGLVAEVDGACPRCGEPERGPRCRRCELLPPRFERAVSVFQHEGAVARAIHRLKYEDRSELARPLGRALAAMVGPGTGPFIVVPVPLHPSRFRERRFCQASLLAAEVARARGWTLELDWLERRRATRKQMELHEDERDANVAGAFRAGRVHRAPVLLVDDVFTTGATVRACAAALLDAGVESVTVATVARARRHDG